MTSADEKVENIVRNQNIFFGSFKNLDNVEKHALISFIFFF